MAAPQQFPGDKRDGLWHPSDRTAPAQQKVDRWVGHLEHFEGSGTYVVKTTRRGHAGQVFRYTGDNKWEWDRCPHVHNKASAAKKCAEAAAKRLNRKLKAEK